ncbi:tripartite tricarboxylate transporter substrate binding protein [Alcaligenaceae bacterium]|nr:tripartite tricarboxylate transporter substrate binding protein [Alcaligenaceae bacterium]
MLKVKRRFLIALCTSAALTMVAGPALAQSDNFPNKPVKFMAPYAAGGSSDVMMRLIGERLAKIWQQPVIVENKPGASGAIAAESVLRSQPDGYTVLLAVTAFVQVPHLVKVPYDPIKDFIPLTQLATLPMLFAVNSSVPAKNLAEFVDFAKSKPGEIAYGSFGMGSAGHLYMEMFQEAAKIKLLHAPYKGEQPALRDLIGEQIPAIIMGAAGSANHIATGRLVPLAMTGPVRSEQAPDTPTFVEAGYSGTGLDALGWLGLFMPANTPRAIVEKMSQDISTVLAQADLRERMREFGLTMTGTGPDAFSTIVKNDYDRWGRVIRERNIKID